ncbi:MAG: hypothetical protein R3Y35_12360 [Clostridia bacterium]
MERQYLEDVQIKLQALADSLLVFVNSLDISFDEVKALAVKKSDQGHKQEIKEILADLGVKKLSELQPSDYQLFINKLKEKTK